MRPLVGHVFPAPAGFGAAGGEEPGMGRAPVAASGTRWVVGCWRRRRQPRHGEAETADGEGKKKKRVPAVEWSSGEGMSMTRWAPLRGRRRMVDWGRPGHIVSERERVPMTSAHHWMGHRRRPGLIVSDSRTSDTTLVCCYVLLIANIFFQLSNIYLAYARKTRQTNRI